ncbi:hypothetical protein BH09BAC3_BH09BAC3_38510 [soil metagenome]
MDSVELNHKNDTHITPAKELQQLSIFLGKWQVEGQNHENAPVGPGNKINGEETYEWMQGEFFMISKWDRQIGEVNHTGIGLIHYDTESGFFSADQYDNLGYNRTYLLVQDKNVWKLIGNNERATIEFNKNGNSFTENWDINSDDGAMWKPLCSLMGRRMSNL